MRKMILLALVLSGCATKPQPPVCSDIEVPAVMTPRGPLFLLDRQKMLEMLARMHDLQDGRCRLPDPQPKGESV